MGSDQPTMRERYYSNVCGPECVCYHAGLPPSARREMSRALRKDREVGNVTGYKMDHFEKGLIFKGTFIHSKKLGELEVISDAIMGVRIRAQHHGTDKELGPVEKYKFWKNIVTTPNTGVISFIVKHESDIPDLMLWKEATTVHLGERFLIPGFVDTHTHAPQYRFVGCGRIPLLQWLETYTFPTEDKFKNLNFSKTAYPKAVQRHVQAGTTTCCYFATINTPASLVLCDAVQAAGQRACVGKVCMDRNSPKFYCETTQESLQDSELFLKEVLSRDNHLITPIITPRFVPSCSSELMAGLGKQAVSYDLPIQSHLAENKKEIEWVGSLHPDCSSYTDVYDKHGLLTHKTVMAHCIHLSDEEITTLKARQCGVSHCPNSNFSLYSGICPTRKLLNKGVKVGLGTDVAGGTSVSMLDAMRQAINASAALKFRGEDGDTTVEGWDQPLSYQEAFYLATLGGADVMGMAHTIGSFEVGKELDAVVVDAFVADSPFDVYEDDTWEDIFQKFLFCGDDRNIMQVYVTGDLILDRTGGSLKLKPHLQANNLT